jgi:hypothetical protein
MISFTRPWNCPQLSWTSFCLGHKHGQVLTAAGTHVRITAGLGEGRAAVLAGRADGQQTSGPGAVRVGTLAVLGEKDSRPAGRSETKGTP